MGNDSQDDRAEKTYICICQSFTAMFFDSRLLSGSWNILAKLGVPCHNNAVVAEALPRNLQTLCPDHEFWARKNRADFLATRSSRNLWICPQTDGEIKGLL